MRADRHGGSGRPSHRPRHTVDVRPDDSAWAVATAPALPSYADHNPATEQWRGIGLDPDLVGLAENATRTSGLTIWCGERSDGWSVPVTGVLGDRLAWHPSLQLVAGLAVRDRNLHPWVGDYRTRTVLQLHQVRAATSLTEFGLPPLQPLVWYDSRLLLLTPPAGRPRPDPPPAGPAVYEARGPAFVSFEPGLETLVELAGAAVSVLAPDTGAVEVLTSPLLVRGLAVSAEGPVVEYVDEALNAGRDVEGFEWSAGLLEVGGRTTRLRRTSLVPRQSPVRRSVGSPDAERPEPDRDQPTRTLEIPTGHATARLTVWPATAERSERTPVVLWIQPWHRDRGSLPVPRRPGPLDGTDVAGAALDLPLHWPSDATVEVLHGQIVRAVRGAVDELTAHGSGALVVGGHSFGATLALYAMAHVQAFAAAIVHSGCYNRTLTPTGFQYERRPYWEIPALYHAFSALLFADRLDRPVLIVHGAEDTTPATPPDQAVQLYQGIVAAGGHSRLVLLPHEGHNVQYQESHRLLVETHQQWMDRWARQPSPISTGR